MKHHMRAFSVGLFTSAIILLIVFYIAHDPEVTLEELNPEEMIPVLEDQGYSVLSQQEYISYSVDEEEAEGDNNENKTEEDNEQSNEEESNQDEEQNNDDENSNEDDESDESSEVEYSLTVEMGMASSEISDILESEDIIENASDFTDYLEDNDYSISIKPGTFELSSDMSHYEIAEAITSFN